MTRARSNDQSDEHAEAQSEDQPQEQEAQDTPFEPVTFWLAGPAPLTPQVKLLVNEEVLSPIAGHLTVTDAATAALVREHLADVYFEEDIPKNKKRPRCESCGYSPGSYDAMAAHARLHPAI